ncbi:O-antigen ligase family protein [Rubellimicrobium rubrum]|uniref:O-antigen ligase family protein n=1 Tax=Rubellimicrobium rubrum TaxID=2585369 RepID=A0A5C4MX04_9RHOB|nr:O-antigen ligase family protein [Rubellimicrobium rubrum]TNC49144.1 O-antigen ligase family protein [Rubellimicrobium rubrum]
MTARPIPSPSFRSAERAREIQICPNAILSAFVFLSLLFTAWFGTLAALAFLATLMLLILRSPRESATDLIRFWPVLLVPGWCLLSWFWSNYPSVTLRYGIQLAMTFVVAIVMASRLSPRTFLRAAFGAYAVTAVCSLAFGRVRSDGLGWLGIFGSKNELSYTMSTLTLMGLAFVLSRQSSQKDRLFGLAGLLVGLFLIVMGQSTGALVSTMLVAGLGVMLAISRYLTSGLRVLLVLLILLGASASGLVAWEFRTELAALFLETTGKDVTLTGRTDLWSVAFGEIARQPVLGQGFRAFWVPGHPLAEALWAKFGIATKSGFHFHNTWISNAVEIGIAGILIQLAAFLATLVLIGRWTLAASSATALFFAMFMVKQATMSSVEVVAYQQFQPDTVLSVTALIFGLRFRSEARAASPQRRTAIAALKGETARRVQGTSPTI